ncbi:F-box domain-containing protein [Venturia nashicola]|nr:F-box domain-containing protein [Venturia nashicola]
MGLVSSHTKQENAANNTPPLTNLPAEIIYNILSFLPPISLGAVAQTCRLLSEHAYDDKLWQAIVHSNLPATTLKTAAPSPSFRHLYLSHLPYWFLPKHKIWFSDTQATGKLLIARYSPSRQTIEAYTVTASRGTSTFKFWKWNPEVVIHTFEPTVRLDLNQSLLRLRPRDISSSSGALTSEIYMQAETPMRSYRTHQNGHVTGASSAFMLAKPLASAATFQSTSVWPPFTLPATVRSRNTSRDAFSSSGHRPTKLSEVSEYTFRLRRWTEFTHRLAQDAMPMGEDVATYATLPSEAYTPTKLKPWRGIWCGDYSGHGCEFLAILQPDKNRGLPEGAKEAIHARRFLGEPGSRTTETAVTDAEENPAAESQLPGQINSWPGSETTVAPIITQGDIYTPKEDDCNEDRIYRGQLLAVKLTGDTNIPRGEYTFIAPDIGKDGTVRIANEEMFKGARIVTSVGHIAARGYREGILFSTPHPLPHRVQIWH